MGGVFGGGGGGGGFLSPYSIGRRGILFWGLGLGLHFLIYVYIILGENYTCTFYTGFSVVDGA